MARDYGVKKWDPHSPDTLKKWRTCLGCGKPRYSDRCHRICKTCRRREEKCGALSPRIENPVYAGIEDGSDA